MSFHSRLLLLDSLCDAGTNALHRFKARSVAGASVVAASALAFALAAPPVHAGGFEDAEQRVFLRVEARPIEQPIRLYVTVRDEFREPVLDLEREAFGIDLPEGVDRSSASFRKPAGSQTPGASPEQEGISVVLVMDYTQTMAPFLEDSRKATSEFVAQMGDADYAAIVKFNETLGISAEQPFTRTTATGKTQLQSVIANEYPGTGTPLFEAITFALNKFRTTEADLPFGPRAVIVIGDGENNRDTESPSNSVALANQQGIPIFTVGVGTVRTGGSEGEWLTNMIQLAGLTGGTWFDAVDDPQGQVAQAYGTVSDLLRNSYLFTFDSTITDCKPRTISIEVLGETQEVTFTRRPCDPPRQSGGGGAFGPLGLVAGLSLLALRRRFSALPHATGRTG